MPASCLLLAALLLATLGMGTASALTWQTETVDPTMTFGMHTSLALDPITYDPRISYSDFVFDPDPRHQLLFARFDGTGWQTETVDDAGDVGEYSSLALNPVGDPRIAYINDTGSETLKYAWRSGMGDWYIETVGPAGVYGRISLVLGRDGYPRISCQSGSGMDQLYVWKDETGWHTDSVDEFVGADSSLALSPAGDPCIAYRKMIGGVSVLRFAWKDDTTWYGQTVDSSPGWDVGIDPSLAFDRTTGLPRISYLTINPTDEDDATLKYAWNDGPSWHSEEVAREGAHGAYTSLALDPGTGNPRISYMDRRILPGISAGRLKYAANDGGGWVIETVDPTGNTGSCSSLALDGAGNPRISYIDNSGASRLNYARGGHPSPPAGPGASFAAYPQSGTAPHLVQFLDYSSDSKAWTWDFGDGESSTLQYPTHLYNRSGLYTVSLTVTDWAGVTSTKTQYHLIRVTDPVTPAPTPVANFSANATTGSAPMTVAFADASSPSPYHRWWQFGDGSSSTDATPVHTYSESGTYTVNLTVWTSIGTVSTSKAGLITVGVDPRAPVPNFTLSRSSGAAPLYVKFTDASTGSPTSWRWDFSGLAWTTATNPSVIFRQPGDYAITLTATNAYGSSTATKSLTVTGAMPKSVRGSVISVVG